MAVLPDAEQTRLLRAAVWPPAEAARQLPYAQLQACSDRLWPCLYANLKTADLPRPLEAQLALSYRRNWIVGQATRRSLLLLLDQLQDCQFLLIKGAVLGEFVYRDWGARPMGDVDVLAHADTGLRLRQRLEQLGFQLLAVDPHAWQYAGPGLELDLHRHAVADCRWQGADDDYWRHAQSATLAGRAVHLPCPAHTLLHAVVHGARQGGEQSPWPIDAHRIVEAGGVDWELLVESACRRRLAAPVAAALAYLQRELRTPCPDGTVRELLRAGARGEDRLYFWLRDRNLRGPQYLLFDVLDYRRNGQGGYLGHLLERWSLKSAWQLPFELLRRTWRQLTGRVDHNEDRSYRARAQ